MKTGVALGKRNIADSYFLIGGITVMIPRLFRKKYR